MPRPSRNTLASQIHPSRPRRQPSCRPSRARKCPGAKCRQRKACWDRTKPRVCLPNPFECKARSGFANRRLGENKVFTSSAMAPNTLDICKASPNERRAALGKESFRGTAKVTRFCASTHEVVSCCRFRLPPAIGVRHLDAMIFVNMLDLLCTRISRSGMPDAPSAPELSPQASGTLRAG